MSNPAPSAGTTPATRQLFGGIEFARGVAAALVVFHHAGNIVTQPRFFGAHAFGGVLERFAVGVDFFFVLSGFIICWMHYDDLGRRERLPSYAAKRFLRIYPPYWGVLLPLVVLYQVFPAAGIPSQRDLGNVVMSTLLLPYPAPPILGVAWTLVHEIFFYAVFGVLILLGRGALWVLVGWSVAIVIGQAFAGLPFPVSFWLSPYNLEFVMGVGVALLLRWKTLPAARWWFWCGVGVFLSAMIVENPIGAHPFWGRIVFGLSSAAVIAGIVEMERKKPIILGALSRLFGRASYSVYLVHPVALSLAVHIASRLRPEVPLELIVLTLGCVGVAAGVAYHVLVEGHLVSLFRRQIPSTAAYGKKLF